MDLEKIHKLPTDIQLLRQMSGVTVSSDISSLATVQENVLKHGDANKLEQILLIVCELYGKSFDHSLSSYKEVVAKFNMPQSLKEISQCIEICDGEIVIKKSFYKPVEELLDHFFETKSMGGGKNDFKLLNFAQECIKNVTGKQIDEKQYKSFKSGVKHIIETAKLKQSVKKLFKRPKKSAPSRERSSSAPPVMVGAASNKQSVSQRNRPTSDVSHTWHAAVNPERAVSQSPNAAPHNPNPVAKPEVPRSPSAAPTNITRSGSMPNMREKTSSKPETRKRSKSEPDRSDNYRNTIEKNISFGGVLPYNGDRRIRIIYNWLDSLLGTLNTKLKSRDDDMQFFAHKNFERLGGQSSEVLTDVDKNSDFFEELIKKLNLAYVTYTNKKSGSLGNLTAEDRKEFFRTASDILNGLKESVFGNIPKNSIALKMLNLEALDKVVLAGFKEKSLIGAARSRFAKQAEKKRKKSDKELGIDHIEASSFLKDINKSVIRGYTNELKSYFEKGKDVVKAAEECVDFNEKLDGTKKVLDRTKKYLDELESIIKSGENIRFVNCKMSINLALDNLFANTANAQGRNLGRFNLAPTLLAQKIMRLPMIFRDLIGHIESIKDKIHSLEGGSQANGDIRIADNKIVIKKDAVAQNNLKSKCIVFFDAIVGKDGDMAKTVGKFKKNVFIDAFVEVCKKVKESAEDFEMNKDEFLEMAKKAKDKLTEYFVKLDGLSQQFNEGSPFGGNSTKDGKVIELSASDKVKKMNEFIELLEKM